MASDDRSGIGDGAVKNCEHSIMWKCLEGVYQKKLLQVEWGEFSKMLELKDDADL